MRDWYQTGTLPRRLVGVRFGGEERTRSISATHPLAQRAQLAPADLHNQRLLLTGQYCAYRETIEYYFAQRGFTARPCLEIGSFDALKRGVQSGIGIAIVPARAVTPAPEGTVLRDLADMQVRLPVGLVRSSGQYVSRPVLEELIAELRTQAGQGVVTRGME